MEGHGGPRIAFVGGGSYQWGPKIIQDVALNEELRGGTLILHDINDEALEDMHQWGTRALDVARADLELEKTQRLEEALRGADFVVLSISTGAWTQLHSTWRSPPVTVWCRPSATPLGLAVCSADRGTSRWLWRSHAPWRSIALMPSF